MLRSTIKARRWNRIHARKSDKQRLIFKEKLRARRRERNYRPQAVIRTATITIECPEDFSLESNFDGVVQVLRKIRDQSGRSRNERTYIDFRKIRNLSLSAALALAAELDRWNNLPLHRSKPLQAVDFKEWDPKVRRLLAYLGFFDLLNVHYPKEMESKDTSNIGIHYVKFRTGKSADGEAFDRLREQELERVAGGVLRKQYLYAAVTEAMTNVVHHAYESNCRRPNWWLSASHNSQEGNLTIMIYDQGVGIPKTLPRKFQEQVKEILIDDHANLIEAAHELSRTASGQLYRGHGLERDIRGYFNHLNCQGHYRVLSWKGEYIYERKPNGDTSNNKKNHKNPIRGTLIEWKLTI